jgi:uncharacterized protein YfaP (DUF2135 family)
MFVLYSFQIVDSLGIFSFNVPSAVYTLTTSHIDFNTVTQSVHAVRPNQVVMVSMTPSLSSGNYRIVLTWNSAPQSPTYRDLDSFLVTGYGCELFYSRPACVMGQLNATMNFDRLTWGGPETITIAEPVGQGGFVYNYYVHIYTSLV